MTRSITRFNRKVFMFAAASMAIDGYSPTYRQIADGCGLLSISNIAKHIDALEENGYVRRLYSIRGESLTNGAAFEFELTGKGKTYFRTQLVNQQSCPVCGNQLRAAA